MKENRPKSILGRRNTFLLISPWLIGVFIKMEPGLFVSLILAGQSLFIGLEALGKNQRVYLQEARVFPLLVLGALLGLFLQGAGIHYYLAVLFGGLVGSLAHKSYRLPLLLLLQSLVFIRLIPGDTSRAMDILLNLVYGLVMMAAALAIMERRKKNK